MGFPPVLLWEELKLELNTIWNTLTQNSRELSMEAIKEDQNVSVPPNLCYSKTI